MKICVATGTRAEYGLLKPLMSAILKEPLWQLQLLVTGTHLSPEFGLTYLQIEKDGFSIDAKVEMLLSSDTSSAIVKSMGLGMAGYAEAFNKLRPDLLIVLGDRFEMLSVSAAALIFKVPIAHIHGGELTEGAYDDSIRHAITKMSQLHFVSTEEYKQRVIQLGEQPEFVHNVGAIGIDNLEQLQLLTKPELEKDLEIMFDEKNYLVTFHPATLALVSAGEQFSELLKAIDGQEKSFFIFTKANSDTDGRVINEMIDEYVASHRHKSTAFASMGQLRYLSVMKIATAVVGNSSSGIIEAPSFNTPTINIGERQKGRIQADTIINCDANVQSISEAFKKIGNPSFLMKIANASNPYKKNNTTSQIIETIRRSGIIGHQKTFYDLPK